MQKAGFLMTRHGQHEVIFLKYRFVVLCERAHQEKTLHVFSARFRAFVFLTTVISSLIYHFGNIKEIQTSAVFVCLKIRGVMSSITIFHLIHSCVYL